MKCWKYILMLCGCCVLCSCSKPTQEAKFYDYNVIAHAGGGIDGNIYTDSLEALNQSYQNETRLFDIDLRFTSDDEIVLRHDWTQVDLGQPEFEYLQQIERQPSEYLQEQIPREYLPTLEQFKQARILSKYTPLSFRDVVDWMKSHSDAYMVLDVKEDAKETYTWIIEHFKENDEMLNHLVVS